MSWCSVVRFEGPGAAGRWRRLYIRRWSARQGGPPRGAQHRTHGLPLWQERRVVVAPRSLSVIAVIPRHPPPPRKDWAKLSSRPSALLYSGASCANEFRATIFFGASKTNQHRGRGGGADGPPLPLSKEPCPPPSPPKALQPLGNRQDLPPRPPNTTACPQAGAPLSLELPQVLCTLHRVISVPHGRSQRGPGTGGAHARRHTCTAAPRAPSWPRPCPPPTAPHLTRHATRVRQGNWFSVGMGPTSTATQ